jgi:alpha-tubulin suppressor-like RCC1 family protein
MFLNEIGEVYQCGPWIGDGERMTLIKINFPDVADPIRKVGVGWDFTIFLSDAGEAYAHGSGSRGQLGTGNEENQLIPVKINFPPNTARIEEVTVTNHRSVFLSETGKVYACGEGKHGVLGTGTEENQLTPVKINFPPNTAPIKEISLGVRQSMFLSGSGEVYACGEGKHGVLGTGTEENQLTPVKINFPPNTAPIKEISAGDRQTAFISETGEVYICGQGRHGILGTGTEENQLTPVKINFPPEVGPIKKIDTIFSLTMFLSLLGEVYVCGWGLRGRLGTGDEDDRLSPVKINFPPGIALIKDISNSDDHTVFLSEKGEVCACGNGEYGKLGTGNEGNQISPVRIEFPPDAAPVKEIGTGSEHSMFLSDEGVVYGCGVKFQGIRGTEGISQHAWATPVKIDFLP